MKNCQKGFTIIELGIVIVIIGILATLAISYLLNIKEEAYIGTLKSDLSSAYKASLGYYTEDPEGEVTMDILKQYGYKPTEKVVLYVDDGSRDSLRITGAHPSVHGFYELDKDGHIYKK